jgi:MFS family permease
MMWPAILGMTYGLLPRNKAGLAGGLILGAAGIGNALGPLFGGILTDSIGWRWVFLINLPIAVVAALITWKVVRADDSGTVREPIDYRGMTAMCLGLFALLLALDEGTSRGWTNGFILACFAVAAVSLVAFALIERRAGPKALVPDDVIANRTFLMAGLSVLMMSAIFFAALLYLPQFMSKQLGFSAVGSGAGLLPMMGTFALTSFIAGMLYERLGAKLTVSSGAALLAGGMFLLSRVDSGTSYADMVPGMVVLGLGVGLFYSSITTTAITALDPARSSLAGAIVYMLQIAGGSLGLGLNTAIVVTASSLAEGIRHAFLFDGILALAGLVLSLVFAPGKKAGARVEATPHRHRAHH